MRSDVYYFLEDYGFIDDELQSFKMENEKMYEVTLKVIKENIELLESLNLNHEEILTIIRNDVYMLTLTKNKRDLLENIYRNKIKFTNEEIKELIIKYPDLYIIDPRSIDKKLEEFKNLGYDDAYIKEIIKNDPDIVNVIFEED